MGSIIGEQIKISLFGESHGEYIGATIDSLPAGIKIDEEYMKFQMQKRKSFEYLSTPRNENDEIKIISGVFNGYTTGTPLTVLIKNEKIDSSKYEEIKDIARPGHADYSAELKYHGFQNYLGGGHFSGRLTAPIVALGSIALKILQKKGIKIGSHIFSIHNIFDDLLTYKNIETELDKWNDSFFPSISKEKGDLMQKAIINAKEQSDSVGGIIESVILLNENVLGEPFFSSLESKLSYYLFSIGGLKGIEFGLGFSFTNKFGSEVKDEWTIKDGKISSIHNYNGGINGGISNLQPIILRCAFKPTSSISQIQKSINFKSKEIVDLKIEGKHDACIVHRARVVVDSLIALAILDLCAFRCGNEWLI